MVNDKLDHIITAFFRRHEAVLVGGVSKIVLKRGGLPSDDTSDPVRYAHHDVVGLLDRFRVLLKKLGHTNFVFATRLGTSLELKDIELDGCVKFTLQQIDTTLWSASINSHRKLLLNNIITVGESPIINLCHAMAHLTKTDCQTWWAKMFNFQVATFPPVQAIPSECVKNVDRLVSYHQSNERWKGAGNCGQITFLGEINQQHKLRHVFADKGLPYVTLYVRGALGPYESFFEVIRQVRRWDPVTLLPLSGLALYTPDGFYVADVLKVDDTVCLTPFQTILSYGMIEDGGRNLSVLAKYGVQRDVEA